MCRVSDGGQIPGPDPSGDGRAHSGDGRAHSGQYRAHRGGTRGDRSVPERTWDGLPVAQDRPHGAQIVVRRSALQAPGEPEYLLLHRAARGPDYEGDWAWTPPSGARLPGEPVLTAAQRELAEETGISGAELVPVDLSGGWATFALGAVPDTQVRLDAEHDRFAWLPADQAARLCTVEDVAAAFRRAAAAALFEITFRPLATGDLADLVAWMHAPHAARWFPEDLDLAQAERKYGPRIDGTSGTRVHVVLVGGRACGFIQHYRAGDSAADSRTAAGPDTAAAEPDTAAADPDAADPDAAGIDYLIGVQGLTGRGLGPQLIWNYLRQVIFPARPAVRRVIASPQEANVWSIRALEKAGFRVVREVTGEHPGRPEMLCVLDRQHIFG